jgi:Na+-translocating ferredoxin:NAD+ oxidoreductase RnfE subunit
MLGMAKLTLIIDAAIVARARRYAKRHGISLSKLIETFLAGLVGSPTPVLDSVRGVLKKGDVKDYRRHLIAKYR